MAADIIPLDEHGQFPVDFVGGPGTFQRRSLWGVLEGEYPAVFFENNIILIGPVAAGIGDGNFPTSAHRGTATFGIEIYANIIQNLFEGDFKQAAPWWLNTLVLAVVGIIIILLMQKLKPVPALVATLVLSAALIGAARLMYDMGGNILLVGAGIVFLLLCYLTSLVLDILSAQNDKQHIQGLFGRFVSPEVVKQIVESGEELKLGGSVRDITVVFVDIRGFTAFSEVNEPEVVVAMVNRYLDLTSRSIQENGGTIDKYIGDATMAIFNAPNDLPNHAMQAIKAAWAMKEGAVPLREEILRDYGVDLQFGVGVNTGPAVIGNMGSEFRMDYTAIGDTVNTAARLESNSQKGQIIISDSTYQLVKDNITATDMGLLNVKNKAVGIQIYELQGVK
jgi:adenylate cyclase